MNKNLANDWVEIEEVNGQSEVLALQRVSEMPGEEWSVSVGEVKMGASSKSSGCSHSSFSIGC